MKIFRLVYIALILAAIGVMVAFSERSSELAADALNTCAKVIVPSLFPYMVISSLVISSGAGEKFGILASPITKLLSLPSSCGSALILGALCGFPIGAASAVNLYEKGYITKAQCERVIAVANNTGPAFIIGVVGTAFWNSKNFGIMLYATQIISAVVSAYIVFSVSKSASSTEKALTIDNPKITHSSAKEITDAITSSACSVLSVCGYVVFFSVVIGLVSGGLEAIGAHKHVSLIVSSLAEFTVGSRCAASVGGAVGMGAAGFTIGWSGLSVFCQSSVFTSRCGLSLATAVKCKLLQGLICAGICAFLGRKIITASESTVTSQFYFSAAPSVTIAVYTALIIISAVRITNKIFKESI